MSFWSRFFVRSPDSIIRARAHVVELELGPHDILVLSTERSLSDSTFARLKQDGEEFLESGKRVLVLTEGLRAYVIRRKAPRKAKGLL